jgi:glycosyltransferase involved in cell wall biosynthesis
MEDKKPLLSICIPTHNRDYIIKECLGRLCPIANKYNVQIHISDNASPDDTEKVIKEYMNQYKNIYYYKQNENIGEKNFEFILKQPDTKYRWLFGDSAFVSEDNLRALLDDLSNNDFDIYVVGSVNRTEHLNEKIYTSRNELLSEIGWHMTFLSCLIYNTAVISRAYYKRYYDSNFIQTGIIFEYCSINDFVVKFNPRVFINVLPYSKKGSWFSIAFEIFCRKWFLFIMSLPVSYTYEAKKECIISHDKNTRLFSVRNLLLWRNLKYYNIKTILRYKYFILQTISLPFVFLLSISIIPTCVLASLRSVYKKIKAIRYNTPPHNCNIL